MRMFERHLTEVVKLYDRYSDHQHYISVFKICVIWGIFVGWFADALLFDMMIKTSYKDGVDTIQDFIDRDMFLGKY